MPIAIFTIRLLDRSQLVSSVFNLAMSKWVSSRRGYCSIFQSASEPHFEEQRYVCDQVGRLGFE